MTRQHDKVTHRCVCLNIQQGLSVYTGCEKAEDGSWQHSLPGCSNELTSHL